MALPYALGVTRLGNQSTTDIVVNVTAQGSLDVAGAAGAERLSYQDVADQVRTGLGRVSAVNSTGSDGQTDRRQVRGIARSTGTDGRFFTVED